MPQGKFLSVSPFQNLVSFLAVNHGEAQALVLAQNLNLKYSFCRFLAFLHFDSFLLCAIPFSASTSPRFLPLFS